MRAAASAAHLGAHDTRNVHATGSIASTWRNVGICAAIA